MSDPQAGLQLQAQLYLIVIWTLFPAVKSRAQPMLLALTHLWCCLPQSTVHILRIGSNLGGLVTWGTLASWLICWGLGRSNRFLCVTSFGEHLRLPFTDTSSGYTSPWVSKQKPSVPEVCWGGVPTAVLQALQVYCPSLSDVAVASRLAVQPPVSALLSVLFHVPFSPSTLTGSFLAFYLPFASAHLLTSPAA